MQELDCRSGTNEELEVEKANQNVHCVVLSVRMYVVHVLWSFIQKGS